jgi:hypothetical protein
MEKNMKFQEFKNKWKPGIGGTGLWSQVLGRQR